MGKTHPWIYGKVDGAGEQLYTKASLLSHVLYINASAISSSVGKRWKKKRVCGRRTRGIDGVMIHVVRSTQQSERK